MLNGGRATYIYVASRYLSIYSLCVCVFDVCCGK